MDMFRVWPIFWQFGVGAILCIVGTWFGIRGGYLNLKIPEDRRLLILLIGGYLILLAYSCIFTFWAPQWANGAAS